MSLTEFFTIHFDRHSYDGFRYKVGHYTILSTLGKGGTGEV